MLIQNFSSFYFKSVLFKNLALAGFFAFAITSCDLYSSRIYKKTVVQVEDQTLSVQEFSRQLALKLKYLDPLSAKDSVIVSKFKNEIVSSFVVDQLITLWFVENKLQLDEAALKSHIEKHIAGYPSDNDFRKTLGVEGLSLKEWENSFRMAAKREALFEHLRKKTDPISEEEIKNYYETNKANYYQKESVLVKSVLFSDESQSDIIKKLYRKTSIEKIVEDYSIEKPKPKDGVYGWVERDTSHQLEVLFINKKNELIGPIQFEDGWRLFKVVNRKMSRQKQLEEVSAQVRLEILSLREKARFSAWLDEQIKRYKILKNTEAITSLRVETRKE